MSILALLTTIMSGQHSFVKQVEYFDPAQSQTYDLSSLSYQGGYSVIDGGSKLFAHGANCLTAKWLDLDAPYDLSSFTVRESLDTYHTSGCRKFVVPDGDTVYAINNDYVWEYSLSAAFDFDSSSYVGAYSFTPPTSTVEFYYAAHFFNPDGTRIFMLQFGGNKLIYADLNTAYDISSRVSSVMSSITLSDVAAAVGLVVSDDKTHFATLDYGNDNLIVFRFTGDSYDFSSIEIVVQRDLTTELSLNIDGGSHLLKLDNDQLVVIDAADTAYLL